MNCLSYAEFFDDYGRFLIRIFGKKPLLDRVDFDRAYIIHLKLDNIRFHLFQISDGYC